jgi:two-component system chemotaxis sensor kinase CheA
MSDRDALRMIFLPGFSTAAEVTDVSGRGVGMDVVKTNIEKAGGTVEIDNHPGVGMSVNIRLPLTLAIVPSLIVCSGKERYAIPQVSISELVRIKAGEVNKKIEQVSGAEVLRLRGSLLPLVRLDKALGWSSQGAQEQAADTPADKALHIIVVEAGHLRYGLIVDGLQDSEEIVVKPLGSHLKGTSCLAGATILGDGHVALILDVAGIAGHCRLSMPRENPDSRIAEAADRRTQEMQTVLLFTNDPQEQFAIPMGLISRLERIRASQIDSVGGQEVLQYRGSSLPLLSLENCIKAKGRPEQDTLYVVVFRVGRQEVGLVAPTLVDIRDIDAHLDIVTFREPGILGSTVVEDHATRLIDLVELVRVARPEWLTEEITRNAKHTGNLIFLAEDSNFFRKQMEDLFKTEGYEVKGHEDGAIAWQALQDCETLPDLVVTDIEMPNMDGYGLTAAIKGDPRFKQIPVIAVTSLAGQEDMERGRQAGVDDYQIKLDRDQLIEGVRRFLKSVNPAPAAMQTGRKS